MPLTSELAAALSADRVLDREIDRVAWANDASVYRRVPQVVVLPESIDEIRSLFRISRDHELPLTFRAAGTSLSGQAVTDGILAVVSRHWREFEVEDGGRRVRVQPGAIGGAVNRSLLPFGVKLGPDPASINACMLGGILANNSSGMCCGIEQNAYRTLESMSVVLTDGTLVDSGAERAEDRFAAQQPELAAALLGLKSRVEADDELRERIRRKHGMKNTMGYGLNALLDFKSPVEILTHLMIGSEGTLGFIAEAVLRTVPDHRFKLTGLLYFANVPDACSAIAPLRESGARALELMDRGSLRSIEEQPGVPGEIRELDDEAAALLVEYQCESPEELEQRRRDCERTVPDLPLLARPELTEDPDRQAALWRVRKGLIPTVGAMRARGTAFIIEDVVFPLERLARGVIELQALFRDHGYADASVFGHAKDGNLHFVLTQSFEGQADVERYDRFMRELAELVAERHGGALKAEHGTGRNMAPFVATEWGDAAYATMREIKELFDPDGLLNPGVLINDDPRAHVKDLKTLPTVEAEVDACIECGFCERVCPSRDLTLTPRQRIVVRREIARLRSGEPRSPRLAALVADYDYAAIETCAADGLCALACPVGIDTGALVKRIRGESRNAPTHELALWAAARFGWLESAVRIGLGAAHMGRKLFGDRAAAAGLEAAQRILGGNGVPLPGSLNELPRPAPRTLPATDEAAPDAIYVPACINRVLGPQQFGDRPLAEVVVDVCRRSGIALKIPPKVHGHCCGLSFGSKGFEAARAIKVRRFVDDAWRWTEEGRLPIVLDASPCAHALRTGEAALTPTARNRWSRLRIQDGIEFALERVIPAMPPSSKVGRVAMHPACSAQKLGLDGDLETILRSCAGSVVRPTAEGCCGFAGDRGFSRPELTASALASTVEELRGERLDGHYSSSRTCEIGLSRATGADYRSFWYLLHESDPTTR